MHERLKKIIFKKLDQDLGHAEIIVDDNNSIWFIDRANKHWYLELRSEGVLWWRYSFFNDFFPLFGMERKEYEPVIAEWVEEVLKCNVSSFGDYNVLNPNVMEEVLKRGVSSTLTNILMELRTVEEVLKHGVSSTNSKELLRFEVEKILYLKAGVRENKTKIKKVINLFKN
jgi:hypothetical protein